MTMEAQTARTDQTAQTTLDATDQAVWDDFVRFLASGGNLADLKGLEDRHLEALYAMGHQAYGVGDYERAIDLFEYLVILNPLDRRFPLALGSALHMKGSHERAIHYYLMASTLDMMDPVPVFHMGECLIALGQVEQARDCMGFVVRQAHGAALAHLRERASGILDLLPEVQS
jgi:type III secretion system low calcium response chaperone LcrH/SycD